MELIDQFGLNPLLLGAQIVNFVIVLFILKKFLYKPILEALEKRKHAIKEGLRQAEEASQLLEKSKEVERTVLRKAQAEAKKLMDQAKKESENLIATAHEEALNQAEKMIADARETIQDEVKKSEARLSSHTSKLAIEILEKTLSGFFGPKEQQDIMQKAIKRLKGKIN